MIRNNRIGYDEIRHDKFKKKKRMENKKMKEVNKPLEIDEIIIHYVKKHECTEIFTCTGLKKCNPTNLSGLPDLIAMVVTGREDVFEANMAEGFISGPSLS